MPGQVITFYSYKGGTGRSMAMCSVAVLLARRSVQGGGKGVLLVDWDLEAPGLHRFFRDRLPAVAPAGSLDAALQSRPGLIDLFQAINAAIPPSKPASRSAASLASKAAIAGLTLSQYVLPSNVPGLSLLSAGQFDPGYSSRVNQFQWEDLHQRAPRVYLDLAERLCADYDYVLIDSRTGLTDISGICTMLMPERLVVVFTPNRQSLTGVADLVRRAIAFRKGSDDLRPLIVFPLASRVENAEPTLKQRWRFGDSAFEVEGYQPLFETLLMEAYQLPECLLSVYFNEVMIQHVPQYAYGESIAALTEIETTSPNTASTTSSAERLSLSRSYEDFADRLIYLQGPWEDWSLGLARKAAEETDRICEQAFTKAAGSQGDLLLAALTRLVRVAQPSETVPDKGGSAALKEFHSDVVPALQLLASSGVLVKGADSTGQATLAFAADNMVRDWDRLSEKVEEDRDFLQWRQRLDAALEESKRSGHELGARLSGARFTEAHDWLRRREADLSEEEVWYIRASASSEGATQPLEPPFSPAALVHVARKSEQEALRAVRGGGLTLLIIGPRGSGKTSLLNRISRESGIKDGVELDYTFFGKPSFAEFLDWFVTELSEDFHIQRPAGGETTISSCTRFLERILTMREAVLITLDEADSLPFLPEFLELLRAFEKRRSGSTRVVWNKLTLVVAMAVDPSHVLGDSRSFSGGLRVVLDPFTPSEAAELNRLHGSPFNAADLQRLVELVGGAPDLVRRALYAVASGQMDTSSLFGEALSEKGAFGEKLIQLGTNQLALAGLRDLQHLGGGEDYSVVMTLLKNGYVTFQDGRYRPVGHLFTDYVRRLSA